MNKKAFTLIELLAIVLLLGLIIALALGSYTRYLNKSKKDTFKIAEANFVTATRDAYADCISNNRNNDFCNNHKELNTAYKYELTYLKELVNDDYSEKIKNPYDVDQYCDIDKSYVYASSKNNTEEDNNSDVVYKVCLICGDHKSEECLSQEELDKELDTPIFDTTCQAYYDYASGELYDGKWTDRNVYLSFGANGNYRYGIDYYEYSYNGSSSKLAANRETNTALLQLDKSVKNYAYTVQAFDGMYGRGTKVNCGGSNIKIDKGTINSVSITGKNQSGTAVASNDWSASNITLTASVNPSTSVSGYLYQWYKDGEKYGSQTSSNTLTVSAKGTYKVEVTNQVGKIVKTSNEYVVKVDTQKPSCTLAATGTKYNDVYTGNVTISFSSVSDKETDTYEGSGIKSQTINLPTITADVSNQVVTGTVIDNVGRSNTCTITITKDTKTPTIVASSATNYITTSTGKNISSYFVDSFGVSSGTTVCKVGTKTVTNTNNLSLGVNTVTCTSTGNNGKTDTATTVFRHQYTATAYCSGGRIVSNGNCIYNYTNNESQCGCKTYNGYCASYECTSYNCAEYYCNEYNSCSSCSCKLYKCNVYTSTCLGNCYGYATSVSCPGSDERNSKGQCCKRGYYSGSTCGTGYAYSSNCSSLSAYISTAGCESYNSCSACGCKSYGGCKTYGSCASYNYNNCTNWVTTTCSVGNDCTKTENNYRYYGCPTTGINGNTNAAVSATLSSTTCSF